jgi:hypothetical protein
MNTRMPEVSIWYQELASGGIEYPLLDGEVGE